MNNVVNEVAVIDQLKAEVRPMLTQASAMQVVDAESFSQATLIMSELKSKLKKAEEMRVGLTAPFNEGLRRLNNMFKTATQEIDLVVRTLSQRVGGWQLEQERQAAEERRKFEAQVKREERKATPMPVAAPAPPPPKTVFTGTGAVTFRTDWEHEVTDITKVPRPFLMVDDRQVTQFKRQLTEEGKEDIRRGKQPIPGIRIYEIKVPVNR